MALPAILALGLAVGAAEAIGSAVLNTGFNLFEGEKPVTKAELKRELGKQFKKTSVAKLKKNINF